MQQSIWEKDVDFPSFPKLEGYITTDVLVSGGGICEFFAPGFWSRQDWIMCL